MLVLVQLFYTVSSSRFVSRRTCYVLDSNKRTCYYSHTYIFYHSFLFYFIHSADFAAEAPNSAQRITKFLVFCIRCALIPASCWVSKDSLHTTNTSVHAKSFHKIKIRLEIRFSAISLPIIFFHTIENFTIASDLFRKRKQLLCKRCKRPQNIDTLD